MPSTAQPASTWHKADPPLRTQWYDDVSPENALPEYPRPQMARDAWLNLNGLWQFAPAANADDLPFGKTLPEQILVPYPVESALSGVMRHEEKLWYRREFDLPASWSGERVLLHFGAVDWQTTVYVNGQQIGTHTGGYDGFSFDVTDQLNAKIHRKSSSTSRTRPITAGSRAANRSRVRWHLVHADLRYLADRVARTGTGDARRSS